MEFPESAVPFAYCNPGRTTATSSDSSAHRRPLHLGQFGVYDRGPQEDRVQWLSFVTREGERRGWNCGDWQCDGDFILFNIPKRKWGEPVLHAIMPESQP